MTNKEERQIDDLHASNTGYKSSRVDDERAYGFGAAHIRSESQSATNSEPEARQEAASPLDAAKHVVSHLSEAAPVQAPKPEAEAVSG